MLMKRPCKLFKAATAVVVSVLFILSVIPVAFADGDDPAVSQTTNAPLYNALVSAGVTPATLGVITQEELMGLGGMLDLRSSGIANIDGLQYCSGITTLILDNNPITDISALRGHEMTNLRRLSLSGCYLIAIPTELDMPNLHSICAPYNANLVDLSGVSEFANTLNTLEVNNSSVNSNSLTCLSIMSHLSYIDASQCYITDFSALTNMPNLTEMNLSSNNISLLPNDMSKMVLQQLYISDNHISDINEIARCSSLRTLEAERNQITSITALPSGLESLDLSSNLITDISGLSDLTSLNTLRLGSNKINNIAKIPMSVSDLDLSNNIITDIGTLDRTFITLNITDNYLDLTPHSNDWEIINNNGFDGGIQKTITVKYDVDGASAPIDDVTDLYYGQAIHMPNSTGSPLAGSLIGWDTNNDGIKDVNLDVNATVSPPISSLSVESPSNITYKAVYNAVRQDVNPELYNALFNAGISPANPGAFTSTELEKITGSLMIHRSGNNSSSLNLSGLQYLRNTEALSLSDNNIYDLTPIGTCTSLEYLDLDNNAISNASPIAGLTNLKYLYLHHNNLTGFDAFTSMTSLEELDAGNNQIHSLPSNISAMNHLKYLDFSNNTITNTSDWNCIATLPTLETLDVGYTNLADVSFLAPVPTLRYLLCYGDQNITVNNLIALNQLSRIDISLNRINNSDLYTIASHFPHLQSLQLNLIAITDLSGLATLTELKELGIAEIGDRDSEAATYSLEKMHDNGYGYTNTKVREFSVKEHKTEGLETKAIKSIDLSPLAGMTQLMELDVRYNFINDIGVLSHMSNLQYISAPGNCISDISALRGKPVTYLDLSGNYLDPTADSPDMQVIKSLPAYAGGHAYYSNQDVFTVSYNNDASKGTASKASDTNIYYGQNITLPTVTEHQGYSFYGWDIDGNGKADQASGAAIGLSWPVSPLPTTTITYTAIYGTLSPGALQYLGNSTGSLSQAFDAGVLNYTLTLDENMASVAIAPTKAYAADTMTVNGSKKPSTVIKLNQGAKKVVKIVVVQSTNKKSKRTYTVTVYRQKSSNCDLKSLKVDKYATMTPGFSAVNLSYSVIIPAAKKSAKITVAAPVKGGKITINGKKTTSSTVRPALGQTMTVNIVVTAPNGTTTKTYRVTISRAAS